MKRGRWILAMGLVVVLLLPGAVTGSSQPEAECEYFSETGHWVCGEFLDFFHTRGGLELFGYPLTEAFDDPMHGGLRVQYFQRARMEWHPSKPSPHKVLLGLLVDELAYDFPRAEQEQVSMASGPLHHYFPETQHVVSFAFLDYFRKQGGVDIFGYPRSEFMYESGRIVQYFQRARMEWHPESRGGPQMRLANLGEVYIEEFGLPGDYDDPVPPAARPDETVSGAYDFNQGDARLGSVATRLNLDASVQLVITGREGTQTLFVYVSDQQRRPMEGVPVTATVRYPSRRQPIRLDPTDDSGFTRASFDILPTSPGKRVVIDVFASYRGLATTTQMFFLPWW